MFVYADTLPEDDTLNTGIPVTKYPLNPHNFPVPGDVTRYANTNWRNLPGPCVIPEPPPLQRLATQAGLGEVETTRSSAASLSVLILLSFVGAGGGAYLYQKYKGSKQQEPAWKYGIAGYLGALVGQTVWKVAS